MFEEPLVHPVTDSTALKLFDSTLAGAGTAFGLRCAYVGFSLWKPQVVFNADGSYTHLPPGFRTVKGIFSVAVGVYILYQGLSYANLTLFNRNDKYNGNCFPLLFTFFNAICFFGRGLSRSYKIGRVNFHFFMFLGLDVIDILIIMVGISLLPLFVDVLNTFIPIGRFVHQNISRGLVCILVIQYVASLFYFFAMVIPFYSEIDHIEGGKEQVIHVLLTYKWWESYKWSSWSFNHKVIILLATGLALWLWCNTIYCYVKTMIHSPSRLSPHIESKESGSVPVPQNPSARHCHVCKINKEEGTHHCKQCGKCIEQMDHHCPFTANCVSTGEKGNFTYFFLFIFYTCLGSGFVMVTMIQPFYRCFWVQEMSRRCIPVGNMSLILLPAVILFVATGLFTALHVILILFGKSTIQGVYWLNQYNPFSSGPIGELDIIKENDSLQKISKLHCNAVQFLFPVLMKENKMKTK